MKLAILASEALIHENKKSSKKTLPRVEKEPRPLKASDSNSNTLLSTLNLKFADKTETLGSSYSHAVLIVLESSKYKN